MSNAAHMELLSAVDTLATAWGGWTMSDVGERFTCTEAEALADVFRAAGQNSVAEDWLSAHAQGDYDEDDLHHDRYGTAEGDE